MAAAILEIKLVQLKNCFANIPQSLINALGNANAVVQDVVVELQYASNNTLPQLARNHAAALRSIYVGWTGMASSPKPASPTNRGGRRAREEGGLVELDATFGHMLGLVDGQKVNLLLHLDPPLAHTVNIEPLSPADWEIIELHASFLESNLLFQVRALPNPSFTASSSTQTQHIHPLTIHLSPTSTANVIITSLTPPQSSSIPFAKIAPDGEVIVAPKSRPRLADNDWTTSRSIASAGRRSGGARSGISTRQRSHMEHARQKSVFLRPIARSICESLFDEDEDTIGHDRILAVWIDQDTLRNRALKGSEWVSVSIINPDGIKAPSDPQQQNGIRDAEVSDAGMQASKIVASLRRWEDAPDAHHAALSSALCSALDVDCIVGGVVRIEAAPQRSSSKQIEGLRIFPFISSVATTDDLRLGRHSDTTREDLAERVRAIYSGTGEKVRGLLDGPITDGQMLPSHSVAAWEGGIVRFKARPSTGKEPTNTPRWCMGSDVMSNITVQQDISRPANVQSTLLREAEPLRQGFSPLTGIDNIIGEIIGNLLHRSSVLLTGGLGSGKSSLSKLLAQRLQSDHLYHTSYLSCRKLMAEETRIATIKDTFSRIVMAASWGTRLGGHALIILDDLDKLCPVETELQTSDNGRSRQVSELLCSMVREYCRGGSNTVLLATAQSKEALHSLIVGANIVKEIIPLRVPDKDGRRKILQAITGQIKRAEPLVNGATSPPHAKRLDGNAAWTAGSPLFEPVHSNEKFAVDHNLGFLDIAGQTDGYMPGDLVLLVSRAKNEALIRAVDATINLETTISLTVRDFQRALEGFTPASLRNVTLQSSRTTFGSIGGLREARKILLETLQYPTRYAPIFAKCPLRLRSGLLLYGYPGCGKTLLASAVAGECGLNFISVKGPEILNKYIGASEKSVRDLFERAESAKPCVLFFDEFDSIAPKRGHDSTGVTDRVVNQLLTQMDGAEGLTGVYVLAATSRPDLIDPALLRPGRLDKSLFCDMPGLDDRLDILQALAKKLTISPSVLSEKSSSKNLADVARRTAGYSGADLQAVVYNAHLEAIHDALGDRGANDEMDAKKSKESKKRNRALKHDILQFRLGKDESTNSLPNNRPKDAAEYAAIIAKLDALKLVKKKERQARRAIVNGREKLNGDVEAKENSTQKVVIEWKHMEASLADTRSSISADEGRRLERIYREFVVGRNGEMPDGQGPTDIGGRSSLM
ncbi:MAG: hypothetical protein Q9217_002611 [Psora testacea]